MPLSCALLYHYHLQKAKRTEACGDAPHVINEAFLFHPVFLSGHFKSVFETKYVTPVIRDRRFDIVEFRGSTPAQKKVLTLLRKVPLIQDDENSEFLTRNLFSEIWLLLTEEICLLKEQHTPLKSAAQDRIQTMLAYIQANYAEHMSLSDIAASAAISTRECTRCFKNTIHKTPFEYLMDYRLDMAEKMLKNTEEPILDIAMKCGFSNGAYFGKIFKEQRGITPGAFRKRSQKARNSG